MNIRPISEWTLYKHRFLVAYTSLAVLVGLLLFMYADQIPPGLSNNELNSTVISHAISFTELPAAAQVVNLPYHALQKISVEFLGLTPYGVRLPSIIFAAFTALCVSLIIKRWFKTNVAIVATTILVTSGWFLALGRLGTPDIMIPFWTSVLILSATYVSQQTKRWHIWKAVFGLSAALALYTPYMAYLFIATMLAAIAQPHLRYLIRQSSKVGLTIGAFFFALVLAPLGWGVYRDPTILRDIMAIPAILPEPLQFGKDLVQAISNLANPLNTASGEMVMPLISISVLAISILGAVRLFGDFHSVRAYVLLIWMAILLPIIGFNPGNLTVLFVPAMLVMAIGLNLIVRYWYRIFPRNPYARLFGLLPLFLLVISIVQFNYQRYTYTMLYSKQVGAVFNNDAFLLQKTANNLSADTPLTLVVPAHAHPLYHVIADRRPHTKLVTAEQPLPANGTYIVAEGEAPKIAAQLGSPTALIVNDRSQNSLLFRIYQR